MKTIFTELLLADVAVGPLTLTGCRETATDLDRTNENSPALEKPMAYAQLVADGLATGNGAPSGAHYTLNLMSTRHSRTTSGLTTTKASSWLSSASTRFPPT